MFQVFMFFLLFNYESNALSLKVTPLNLKKNKGVYRCLLFNSSEGFPSDISKAIQFNNTPVINKTSECLFVDLEPGFYAISSFHDENANSNLDTNFLGIPKEPYGFSNNASKPFGPPDFDEAKFEVTEDSSINIKLK